MAKLNRGHSLTVRFWFRVSFDGPVSLIKGVPGKCWPWNGKTNQGGYAQLAAFGRQGVNAHRVSYELQVGPIPAGLHLDHLCRVRHCMNPDHLEPVTMAENTRRGKLRESAGSNHRARTHCPKGHDYTPENTRVRRYPDKGWTTRECRTCHRIREGERYAAGLKP